MLGPKLTRRVLVPEIMDDPGLDSQRHEKALASLARINRLSASSRTVWQPIHDLSRRIDKSRPLRILDIATGSGDMPVRLWQRAKRAGIALEIVGVDISDRALGIARQRLSADMPIEFRTLDAISEDLPAGFDVVTSSLFLHHLEDAEAERLMGKMAQCAKRLVVIHDLRRCRRGWWLALLASRTLSSSDVVHTDACLSVQAAFTIDEVRQMANRAAIPGVAIRRRWPLRFVLTAKTP